MIQPAEVNLGGKPMVGGALMGPITLPIIYNTPDWPLDTTVPETRGLGAPHTLIGSGGLNQGSEVGQKC